MALELEWCLPFPRASLKCAAHVPRPRQTWTLCAVWGGQATFAAHEKYARSLSQTQRIKPDFQVCVHTECSRPLPSCRCTVGRFFLGRSWAHFSWRFRADWAQMGGRIIYPFPPLPCSPFDTRHAQLFCLTRLSQIAKQLP